MSEKKAIVKKTSSLIAGRSLPLCQLGHKSVKQRSRAGTEKPIIRDVYIFSAPKRYLFVTMSLFM